MKVRRLLVIDFLFIRLIILLSSLANTLKALTFNSDSERNFNERLLVTLGFVKVRKY